MSLIPTTSLIRDSSDSNPAFVFRVGEVSDYYLACFHKYGGIYIYIHFSAPMQDEMCEHASYIRFIYVNMRDNYVNMLHYLCCMST